MSLYIGIDGGGTRTTAVAIDGEGRELARLHGGAGLVRSTDPTAGAAALADLAERTLRAAGAAPPAVSICCALAGAGREKDRLALAAALQREAITERIRIVTDLDAAFHDAFGNGPGILLIAGTGSIAFGRTARGRTARVGGWGSLLGDEGSGYALGLAALRASLRAYDGRGEPTSLLPTIMRRLLLDSADELIHWAAAATKAEIAALAPTVIDAAAAGDPVARRCRDLAAHELVEHLRTLASTLAPWSEPPLLALAGGLIAPGRPLRPAVISRIQAADTMDDSEAGNPFGASPRILERPVDAARGAAALAL